MNHDDLHRELRILGWREDVRPSGATFFYSQNEIIDRMIQTMPADPQHALCAVRNGGRSITSLPEALAWARVESGDDE